MEKNSKKPPKNKKAKITRLKTPVVKSGKRATSYDVAHLAGVSQSAVSRCFKPGASVSAKTRAKVEKAAKKLGYQPNAIARGLITRRSNIVGVIISDLTNLTYPEVLSHLSHQFENKNVRILLFTLSRQSDVDKVLDQIWQYQLDGIIAAAQFTHEQIAACEDRGIPLVFYNRLYPESTISSVCCDHQEGERLLVDGLIKNGRRSVVVMSGPKDSAVSTARTRGAINQLDKHDVSYIKVEGDYSYDTAVELVRDIMDSDTFQPDAFVCANDSMAIGCIDVLRNEYDIRIPQQIAVVGFDGVNAASWISYDLTTVVQPVQRMVEAAVNMLIERIEDPEIPAEKRLFAGQIKLGASALLE
ncbi:MAG: LacI family DNA-binding transcriptional regulator [Gammaproteobacteria bacterium]|nr:LacI family DNA-binding transcriptional regulator [Gammaproteobacteria bacterium]NNC97273.1 LacI family DNA-binding transcriptional regulator [Gammaproteobacteria bacterium]NNM14690.1 LacI family DNA-binding transcriptional regulator [Gammaproteobacteria bacterium]